MSSPENHTLDGYLIVGQLRTCKGSLFITGEVIELVKYGKNAYDQYRVTYKYVCSRSGETHSTFDKSIELMQNGTTFLAAPEPTTQIIKFKCDCELCKYGDETQSIKPQQQAPKPTQPPEEI